MDILTRGFDQGLPPRMVEHLYRVEGDKLLHFADGTLRATVELAHAHQFVADHPEAALAVGDLVEDLEGKVAEYKRERAQQFTAERQKVSAGADQRAIDVIVRAAVADALRDFQELQRSKARKAAAA